MTYTTKDVGLIAEIVSNIMYHGMQGLAFPSLEAPFHIKKQ